MSATASDGKMFPSVSQARLYDEANGHLTRKSLADIEDAPGGPAHQDAIKHHGIAQKITIERVGNGRTRVESTHQDGFKHTSVHPETFRAHDIARELLGIEPPPALQTHSRARSQPTGPKEEERVRKEDNREEEA